MRTLDEVPAFAITKPLDLPQGWLTNDEALALRELARDKLVLELGSFLGRSTIAMAATARQVVAVDHHRGAAEHIDAAGAPIDTLPGFLANLKQYGVAEKVAVLVSDTTTAFTILAAQRFDLVFVDASHDLMSVLRDGAGAKLLTAPGGLVVFHDYSEDSGYPDVAVAVDRLSTKESPVIPLVGSLVALSC